VVVGYPTANATPVREGLPRWCAGVAAPAGAGRVPGSSGSGCAL